MVAKTIKLELTEALRRVLEAAFDAGCKIHISVHRLPNEEK